MTIDIKALEADLEGLGQQPGSKRVNCRPLALIAEHPEAEEAIRKGIADLRYSAAKIAEVLTRNGLKISENSIKRHRQGACEACKEMQA